MDAFDNILNAGVSLMESLSGDAFTHNGKQYVGNFRTGNALEQHDAATEMTEHGFQRRTIVILEVSRAQFSTPPTAWKRQKIKRLTPTPAEYTVVSVNFDDPNLYPMVLVGTGTQ